MPTALLTTARVEELLARVGRLRIAVVGDLFLDRYLDLDAALTEPSLETGLDAYQVVQVRAYPGAAGTVVNNLSALGVACVRPVAVIGDDGEGHELRQALARLPNVDARGVFDGPGRRTPTYTKPMLHEPGRPARELNRLDIHNRAPLDRESERRLLSLLEEAWPEVDGVVVLDQVSLPDTGVVTGGVRAWLAELARLDPARPVLADSRERIGLFRGVGLKPNQRECLRAAGVGGLPAACLALSRQAGRPVFCTRGEAGILLACPDGALTEVPAYPVAGPVDPVGAGDSTSAGIVCALAAGARLDEAAALGNLVASVTVQQLGTTGTATAEQLRRRWRECGPVTP